MVELDPGGALEELFRAVQLNPLGHGLGNTAGDPYTFNVGIGGPYSHIGVPVEVYTIWSYSLTGGSLWDACVDFAQGIDENLAPGVEPAHLDPHDIAGLVGGCISGLTTAGCGYLDPLNYET